MTGDHTTDMTDRTTTAGARLMAKSWAAGCECGGHGVAFIDDPPRNPKKLHALLDAGWIGCPVTMTLRRPCVCCSDLLRERLFAWVREWLAEYVRKSEAPLRELLDEETLAAYLSTPTVVRERGSIAYSLAFDLGLDHDYSTAIALLEAAGCTT